MYSRFNDGVYGPKELYTTFRNVMLFYKKNKQFLDSKRSKKCLR